MIIKYKDCNIRVTSVTGEFYVFCSTSVDCENMGYEDNFKIDKTTSFLLRKIPEEKFTKKYDKAITESIDRCKLFVDKTLEIKEREC